MPKLDEISERGIAKLVDAFYAKARCDALIGPVFNSTVEDWAVHLGTLRAFWSSVMLTSGRYKGNPMQVHARHALQPEHFVRWLSLWCETANEIFADEAAAKFCTKARRIAQSLEFAVFSRAPSLLADEFSVLPYGAPPCGGGRS
jgi:hemoglobin